jgi:hypothetical protein
MTLSYRTGQFLRSLNARAELGELARAWPILTPPQRALFLQLPAADQVHALQVLDRLLDSGEKDPDLLAAALLHDIGKLRRPLSLWERVFVVLAQALHLKSHPSAAGPQGTVWQQALAVGRFHPEWGAALLRSVGTGPRLIELVERHQDRLDRPASNEIERLLVKLQQADNLS